jgi:phosphoglycolate phosphatase-like HAD superfamily hydrolase
MIQTVIFDMDGVIVDTRNLYIVMLIFSNNINVTEEQFTSFTEILRNVFKNKTIFNLEHEVEEMIQRKKSHF